MNIKHYVLPLAVFAVFALAGCGGGSSDTGPTDEEMAAKKAMEARAMTQADNLKKAKEALDMALADPLNTQAELDAANNAHTALTTAIEEAADVSATDKAMYERAAKAAMDRIDDAQKLFDIAEADRMKREQDERDRLAKEAEDKRKMEEAAQAKEMAAIGKVLRAALGPPVSTVTPQNALGNIDFTTPDTDLSDGLSINAADGAGAIADGTNPASVILKAGDSAGALGGWTGTDYAHTHPATKVKNEARVYTNRGSPTSAPIAEKEYPSGHNSGTYDRGDRSFSLGLAADPNIKASEFPTSGSKDFAAGPHSYPGTYDGASGDYKCTSTGEDCTARFTTGGIVLDAGWTFVHHSGAMASTPDGSYLYYGWWVSKDKDGEPTAASAFTGVVGASSLGTVPDVAAADFQGKATYVGKAAGKFAMSNPLTGTGDGGHFTADAELKATFGPNDTDAPTSTTTGGITGTIDNFRLNDGSTDPGWSVALHRAGWGTTGAFATPDDQTTTATVDESLGTTWSINDNASSRSGAWSGQLYDESPATASGDDGSNLPTTTTGKFYSEFSAIGRMVGAFGAELCKTCDDD